MTESDVTTNPEVLKCQQRGGEMTKTTRANESTGMTVLAVILAIVGIGLLFMFPIGSIIGVILLIAAPKIANRATSVWACNSCGYFFERV